MSREIEQIGTMPTTVLLVVLPVIFIASTFSTRPVEMSKYRGKLSMLGCAVLLILSLGVAVQASSHIAILFVAVMCPFIAGIVPVEEKFRIFVRHTRIWGLRYKHMYLPPLQSILRISEEEEVKQVASPEEGRGVQLRGLEETVRDEPTRKLDLERACKEIEARNSLKGDWALEKPSRLGLGRACREIEAWNSLKGDCGLEESEKRRGSPDSLKVRQKGVQLCVFGETAGEYGFCEVVLDIRENIPPHPSPTRQRLRLGELESGTVIWPLSDFRVIQPCFNFFPQLLFFLLTNKLVSPKFFGLFFHMLNVFILRFIETDGWGRVKILLMMVQVLRICVFGCYHTALNTLYLLSMMHKGIPGRDTRAVAVVRGLKLSVLQGMEEYWVPMAIHSAPVVLSAVVILVSIQDPMNWLLCSLLW
uniref:Uncharacterized protein n=1 Tax=Timema douglasi TaxID=61478 RepID=A0A7R8ZEJ6_TIMDO|nr:unnamed protein product [Timema douglasi]